MSQQTAKSALCGLPEPDSLLHLTLVGQARILAYSWPIIEACGKGSRIACNESTSLAWHVANIGTYLHSIYSPYGKTSVIHRIHQPKTRLQGRLRGEAAKACANLHPEAILASG